MSSVHISVDTYPVQVEVTVPITNLDTDVNSVIDDAVRRVKLALDNRKAAWS